MKKIILIAFILVSVNLLAQDNTERLYHKYTDYRKDYYKFMRSEHGYDVGIGYDILNFPNNDLITNKWGLNQGFRVAAWFPLMFDWYYSVNELQIDLPLYQSKYQNLRSAAMEVSLSVFPVPPMPYEWKHSYLSEYIAPYCGIGIHWMNIIRKDNNFFGREIIGPNLRILNSFMWKAGCNIYIPQAPLVLNFEYKRTLNKESLKDVERFSIGIFFEYNPLTISNSKRITPKDFLD